MVSHHLDGLLHHPLPSILQLVTAMRFAAFRPRGPSIRRPVRCQRDVPATRFVPLEEFPLLTAAPHHCGRCLPDVAGHHSSRSTRSDSYKRRASSTPLQRTNRDSFEMPSANRRTATATTVTTPIRRPVGASPVWHTFDWVMLESAEADLHFTAAPGARRSVLNARTTSWRTRRPSLSRDAPPRSRENGWCRSTGSMTKAPSLSSGSTRTEDARGTRVADRGRRRAA